MINFGIPFFFLRGGVDGGARVSHGSPGPSTAPNYTLKLPQIFFYKMADRHDLTGRQNVLETKPAIREYRQNKVKN